MNADNKAIDIFLYAIQELNACGDKMILRKNEQL